LYSDCY